MPPKPPPGRKPYRAGVPPVRDLPSSETERDDALVQTIVSRALFDWIQYRARADGRSVAGWIRWKLTQERAADTNYKPRGAP